MNKTTIFIDKVVINGETITLEKEVDFYYTFENHANPYFSTNLALPKEPTNLTFYSGDKKLDAYNYLDSSYHVPDRWFVNPFSYARFINNPGLTLSNVWFPKGV